MNISELTNKNSSDVKSTDVTIIENNTASNKITMEELTKAVSKQTNNNLETTDKTIEGAINELVNGGAGVEEIDYSVWNTYTDEQKREHDAVAVINAPEPATTVAECQKQINELNDALTNNANFVSYNSDDDYLYINGARWKKAYLNIAPIFVDGVANYTFVSGNWNGSSYNGACSLDVSSDGKLVFTLNAPNGGTYNHYCRSTSSTTINTIGYKYLIFRAYRSTTSSPIKVGLSTSPTSSGSTNSVQAGVVIYETVTATSLTEYKIDISGYQGEYYFAINDGNINKGTFYTYFESIFLSN